MLNIKGLSKQYMLKGSPLPVFRDLSISVDYGEVVAFIGPNGCGKSTLFNIIAGIDNDYKGEVIVSSSTKDSVGYMFQDDLLLPWKNALDNVLLCDDIRGCRSEHREQEALKLMSLFGVKESINSYPVSLSGGERQKLAFLRTILTSEDLLLLDEPFSAIDFSSRLEIQNWAYRFVKERGITVLIITHDIEEAISIADRVVVLDNRPNGIINDIEIDLNALERDPRQIRGNPKFIEYFQMMWDGMPSPLVFNYGKD